MDRYQTERRSAVMASSSSVLSEDQLLCPICLDVFTDPVTTPCGHNFCMICLKEVLNGRLHGQCPLCKAYFHKGQTLCVNTFISALAAPFKMSVQVKSQVYPSLCSPPHTRDWTDCTINTRLSVETQRRALSQLQDTLRQEMKEIDATELRRIQQHAVDVTLNPDTAHPNLILSDDGKQVTYRDTEQNLPDNPERFDYCGCVLGKEGFSSGRFYYEVQVRGKTKWDLGLVKESIDRKGQITYSPENGYWCVCLRNNTGYQTADFPPVSLSLKQAPQKVGVFVDYEEGLISFYDVDTMSHIYSFTGQTFTEKLYPCLCPCRNDEGNNSAPLIICPAHTELFFSSFSADRWRD